MVGEKKNQDRCISITNYRGNADESFWGVFDGHGSVGHEVTSL
jgi:serine/threonine protein phosphatase PrpC